MSSKPQRDHSSAQDSSAREALPFEPAKSRKQVEKKASTKAKKTPEAAPNKAEKSARTRTPVSAGIPDSVSRRMVKRMAVFSGIPTALGMSTFIVSYFIVSRGIYDLPTYAVLLVSLGFFGLGVLGLSYGAISASWDEEAGGSLGWSEFTTNLGRMTGAWKSSRQEQRDAAKKS
ncbi:PAM68 family protein [Egbenema bharatensis]|uniref:PAM68 family protein n=1 Tax=Egbenema bharatensis TaxID=3463334 RepID=UPI003A84A7F1